MPPALPSSRPSSRPRTPRRRAAVAGLAAAVVAGSSLAALGAPAGALGAADATSAQTSEQGPSRSAVTAIQANIKSDLSVERFQADVATVLSMAPDVVTYNEVPLRVDTVLAPEGYDLFRTKKNRYTAATAVAWRSDEWSLVDSGTFRISNYREIPPGRNIRLGLRFANWVTLSNAEGRTMSVVAAHVAPLDRNMPDLLRSSVSRLGTLVGRLAPAGPVLVGGDFNVHYKSGRYPRDLLGGAEMAPTYDTLQSYFPTGDHQGATIDYVFNRGDDALGATQHQAVELYSDHDAVVTGFDWLVDTPDQTQRLRSDPSGDATSRRLAVSTVTSTLRGVADDGAVDLVSADVELRAVVRAAREAMRRGVEVDLLTRSETLTRAERGLATTASVVGNGSSVTTCADDCYRAWRASGMARTFALVRDGAGRPTLRVDANRLLGSTMLTSPTRIVLRRGAMGLENGERLLGQLR